MAEIKVADFYYGSAISVLLNKGINPALIEGGEDRQIYDITTNHGDARLFVKYRTEKQEVKTPNYNSWMFNLTSSDIIELKHFLQNDLTVILALVCGSSDLADSELAFLSNSEVEQILSLGKGSISISRKKGEKKYRIPIGGGRDKSIKVNCNRLQELFF